VEKPRRLPSTRRAVADKRLAEINHAAATTGDDPELDTLLLRMHTETACRRGGALALRPQDLDPEQCLILLREKGETVRWQPVSPTLMAALLGHAGNATRRRPGNCCATATAVASPTAATTTCGNASADTCVGAHPGHQHALDPAHDPDLGWNFGYAVAHAYAGHTDSGSEAGATATYVRASLSEVAAALAALTGEPHPLATTEGW